MKEAIKDRWGEEIGVKLTFGRLQISTWKEWSPKMPDGLYGPQRIHWIVDMQPVLKRRIEVKLVEPDEEHLKHLGI